MDVWLSTLRWKYGPNGILRTTNIESYMNAGMDFSILNFFRVFLSNDLMLIASWNSFNWNTTYKFWRLPSKNFVTCSGIQIIHFETLINHLEPHLITETDKCSPLHILRLVHNSQPKLQQISFDTNNHYPYYDINLQLYCFEKQKVPKISDFDKKFKNGNLNYRINESKQWNHLKC